MKKAEVHTYSRPYRDAGSWLRFAPAIAVTAGLHGLLLFPAAFGIRVPVPAQTAHAKPEALQVSADARTLARAREEFQRAAMEEAIAASTEAQPEEVATPLKPETAEDVPQPDHSEHKRLEGEVAERLPDPEPELEAPAQVETAKTEAATAEPEPAVEVATTEPAEPAPTPRSASEVQRDALRESLQRIDVQGGHLAAAHRRFEEQAAARRRRGAEGSEKGLPQLYVFEVPAGDAFLSYLDLFGSEVLAHLGAERFMHFARSSTGFEALPMTRREMEQLSVSRGLNLGYVIPLDDVMERLPLPLQEAAQDARANTRTSAATWRLFALGTTREQAAVAAAAQEHLRHHRLEAPTARLWSELDRVEFRYLIDERDRVYGVQVDAVAGPH